MNRGEAAFFVVKRPKLFKLSKIKNMAKTKKGKKIVEVRTHWRKIGKDKRIKIHEHRRSTPN
ncbi:MAG: hypothetical protein HYV51_01795 [Parcubacteria group bacterium]|nr:hypothetical protein [Parcubacteria group bacterium]